MGRWPAESFVMRLVPGIGEMSEYQIENFFTWCTKQPSGCWEWNRSIQNKGYGQIRCGRDKSARVLKAHRVAYALHHGSVPDDLQVCHRCDNRRCINPDHLFLGTQTDNNIDAVQKGRMEAPFKKRRKLSDEQVREIRASTETRALARKFGVTRPTIQDIRQRRSYTEVE